MEYTICGIDPGTNKLGISLLKINPDDLIITLLLATTIIPRISKEEYLNLPGYSELSMKIDSQINQVSLFLQYYKPNAVIVETPYFNPTRPNAFKSLVELLREIKIAIQTTLPNPVVRFYPPSIIKKAIGCNGIVGKIPIKDKILSIEELTNISIPPILKLDDNAIDAIAIAYTYVLEIRGG